MSVPGFPMNGGPIGAPPPQQQPQQSVGAGFTLFIPPDPGWEPFDVPDVLDKDGFYCARITKEAGRTDGTKKRGLFLTLTLQDPDVVGKNLSRFLPDPTAETKDLWFVWRGLLRSITGDVNAGKNGMQYAPGMFQGQLCYFRTKAYTEDGQIRTGVDAWITKTEWDQAVANKQHRWDIKVTPGAPAQALPGGMPGGFPMQAFPGLSGAPTAPAPGVAPMQQAPQQQPPPGAPVFQQPTQQMPPQPQQGFAQAVAPPALQAPSQGFPGFGAPAPQAAPQTTPFPGFAAPGAAPSAPQPQTTPGFPLPGR